MDATTGLLYVDDGQYYDPSTGRFLTRNAKPNQTNPYLPFDPAGAMLGPLGVLALVLGRKKKKSKYDVLLFVLVFAVASGVTVTACGNGQTPAPGSTVEAVIIPVSSNTALVSTEVNATQTPTALVTVPPNTSVEELLNDLCVNIPTPEPMATYDKLNESLLENFPRSTKTNRSGSDYYNWYQKLWKNENGSFSWWWKDHNTFTIWDFITLVFYLELHNVGNPSNTTMYAGFPAYREAVVRVIYQDCKNSGCTGGSPEATLNWLAGYSESGAKLCCDGTPKLKDNPYGSAVTLVNSIRYPDACGASEWAAQGFRTDRPYGVGNKSLYQPVLFNKAANLGLIYWRSGKDTGNEVIIPTGCGSYLLSDDKNNYQTLCGEWSFN